MKALKTFLRSEALADRSFNEFYEELSSNWRAKAERLQARRWQKINRKMV